VASGTGAAQVEQVDNVTKREEMRIKMEKRRSNFKELEASLDYESRPAGDKE